MEKFRFTGKLEPVVDELDFLALSRDAGLEVRHRGGKKKASVIFIESGQIEYRFQKLEPITVDSGAVCFVPPKWEYTNIFRKDQTTIKILMFDVAGGALPEFLLKPFVLQHTEAVAVFNSIKPFHRTSTLFLAGKIYELLSLFANEQKQIPEKYAAILPAIREIHEAYFENKKLSYYAGLCCMSESNFRRLFKEYTGRSLIDYRNSLRLCEAQKLIASHECSVSQAAYLTGFHNMSFFYECYKKYLTGGI